MSPDKSKEKFEKNLDLLREYSGQKLSESDTRSKLIDFLLKSVLGWHETSIKREARQTETGGFVDYLLSTNQHILVIEAKKTKVNFNLPRGRKRTFKIGGVLSEDRTLKKSLVQARDYAVGKGAPICCVTNGWQFVFFRSSNQSGIEWNEQSAVIFNGFEDIQSRFLTFYEILNFENCLSGEIYRNVPLTQSVLGESQKYQRLFPRTQRNNRTRERNALFPILRDFVEYVFQDLAAPGVDLELLEQCYVESARDSSYERGLGELLKDRAKSIPYLDILSVSKKDAGAFEKQVEKQWQVHASGEIILLLGGVGVGKTTFIHRFRNVLAKDKISENCIWAYIDFRHFSDTGEDLNNWVCSELVEVFEQDYPDVNPEDWNVLKQAYHKLYERLKRGLLKPVYEKDQDAFEISFADRVDQEKQEDGLAHLVKVLAALTRMTERTIFLIFDNADQLPSSTQNEVFRLVFKLSSEVPCPAIISLREESYWKNKDFGALSAFHATAYYVEAPRLEQVLAKRFSFAGKRIKETKTLAAGFIDGRAISTEVLEIVLKDFRNTVLGEDKRFISFLEYLSPGELRRPLQMLQTFMFSGHTNVDSLISRAKKDRDLTIGFHEFLTSIALGDREYFQDGNSELINLFALDGESDASHFARIAILARLLSAKNETSEMGRGFILREDLVADCRALGFLEETISHSASFLLEKRLIESETQIREDLDLGLWLRATSAAAFYVETLSNEFSYLDLVLFDTPLGNKELFKEIERINDHIDRTDSRLEKLNLRLNRVEKFIQYLSQEFQRSTLKSADEKTFDIQVTHVIETTKNGFADTRKEVMRNAKKHLKK